MNDSTPDNLESRLEALSHPPTEPTELWRAALEVHRTQAPKRSVLARIGPWVGLAAAVVIVGVMLLPALGHARRERAASSANSLADQERSVAHSINEQSSADLFDSKAESLNSFQPHEDQSRERRAQSARSAPESPGVATAVTLEEWAAASPSPRLVARRADLTLRVTDVREAFLKAQHSANPALGEFVEDSKITGEGPTASADLTLRIASSRLAAALDELRTLGAVISETSSGDDVTDQAVDLDARLRNERRVEEEILQLLDTRKDAPLPDVLKLRDSLTTIRGSIERMDAQRTTITRMVDLSTVLVILRADAAPAPAPAPAKGFLNDLTEQSTAALEQGSRRLAASLARAIEIIVGGALAWTVLAVVALIAIGLARRLIRFAAVEPAPVFRS